MERLKIETGSLKYGFKPGDEFTVKRNVRGECVIITTGNKPNIILSEFETRIYGTLTGKPQLCFN